MDVDWIVIMVIGVLVVGIIAWTSIKNHRDRKRLEKKLNQDYKTPSAESHKDEDRI